AAMSLEIIAANAARCCRHGQAGNLGEVTAYACLPDSAWRLQSPERNALAHQLLDAVPVGRTRRWQVAVGPVHHHDGLVTGGAQRPDVVRTVFQVQVGTD